MPRYRSYSILSAHRMMVGEDSTHTYRKRYEMYHASVLGDIAYVQNGVQHRLDQMIQHSVDVNHYRQVFSWVLSTLPTLPERLDAQQRMTEAYRDSQLTLVARYQDLLRTDLSTEEENRLVRDLLTLSPTQRFGVVFSSLWDLALCETVNVNLVHALYDVLQDVNLDWADVCSVESMTVWCVLQHRVFPDLNWVSIVMDSRGTHDLLWHLIYDFPNRMIEKQYQIQVPPETWSDLLSQFVLKTIQHTDSYFVERDIQSMLYVLVALSDGSVSIEYLYIGAHLIRVFRERYSISPDQIEFLWCHVFQEQPIGSWYYFTEMIILSFFLEEPDDVKFVWANMSSRVDDFLERSCSEWIQCLSISTQQYLRQCLLDWRDGLNPDDVLNPESEKDEYLENLLRVVEYQQGMHSDEDAFHESVLYLQANRSFRNVYFAWSTSDLKRFTRQEVSDHLRPFLEMLSQSPIFEQVISDHHSNPDDVLSEIVALRAELSKLNQLIAEAQPKTELSMLERFKAMRDSASREKTEHEIERERVQDALVDIARQISTDDWLRYIDTKTKDLAQFDLWQTTLIQSANAIGQDQGLPVSKVRQAILVLLFRGELGHINLDNWEWYDTNVQVCVRTEEWWKQQLSNADAWRKLLPLTHLGMGVYKPKPRQSFLEEPDVLLGIHAFMRLCFASALSVHLYDYWNLNGQILGHEYPTTSRYSEIHEHHQELRTLQQKWIQDPSTRPFLKPSKISRSLVVPTPVLISWLQDLSNDYVQYTRLRSAIQSDGEYSFFVRAIEKKYRMPSHLWQYLASNIVCFVNRLVRLLRESPRYDNLSDELSVEKDFVRVWEFYSRRYFLPYKPFVHSHIEQPDVFDVRRILNSRASYVEYLESNDEIDTRMVIEHFEAVESLTTMFSDQTRTPTRFARAINQLQKSQTPFILSVLLHFHQILPSIRHVRVRSEDFKFWVKYPYTSIVDVCVDDFDKAFKACKGDVKAPLNHEGMRLLALIQTDEELEQTFQMAFLSRHFTPDFVMDMGAVLQSHCVHIYNQSNARVWLNPSQLYSWLVAEHYFVLQDRTRVLKNDCSLNLVVDRVVEQDAFVDVEYHVENFGTEAEQTHFHTVHGDVQKMPLRSLIGLITNNPDRNLIAVLEHRLQQWLEQDDVMPESLSIDDLYPIFPLLKSSLLRTISTSTELSVFERMDVSETLKVFDSIQRNESVPVDNMRQATLCALAHERPLTEEEAQRLGVLTQNERDVRRLMRVSDVLLIEEKVEALRQMDIAISTEIFGDWLVRLAQSQNFEGLWAVLVRTRSETMLRNCWGRLWLEISAPSEIVQHTQHTLLEWRKIVNSNVDEISDSVREQVATLKSDLLANTLTFSNIPEWFKYRLPLILPNEYACMQITQQVLRWGGQCV